jgi:hypothetical protein
VRDKKITPGMVAGWEKFSGVSFEHLPIEGHHLFPYDATAKASWLTQIVQRLPGCLVPRPARDPQVRARTLSIPGQSEYSVGADDAYGAGDGDVCAAPPDSRR